MVPPFFAPQVPSVVTFSCLSSRTIFSSVAAVVALNKVVVEIEVLEVDVPFSLSHPDWHPTPQ
jgi:hypothetical protein